MKFTRRSRVVASAYPGETNTSTTAGSAMSNDNAYQRRSAPIGTNGRQASTRSTPMGSTIAAWVAWPRPTSSAATSGRSRRHAATPNNSSAAPQAKDCWPKRSDSMIAGFASTAAAHQPRRSSGNATNVATMHPTAPSAVHSVTPQLPSTGQTNAAVVQLAKP